MAYSYKRSITIDHTKCGSADSTDFPVLVSFTDASFKTVGNGGRIQNSNGYDINFYSDSALTTALNYECEKYVATTGECVFWVKVPTLSYTADTVIYIGYGDSGISTFQGNITGTWESNFKAVYHLKDGTTLDVTDSTSNANNGTKVNTPTAATGKIDGAMNLVASSSQCVTAANASSLALNSNFTISCWMKIANLPTSGNIMSLVNKYDNNISTFPDGGYDLRIRNSAGTYQIGLTTNGTSAPAGGGDTNYSLSANTWYHFVGVYDGSNSKMYINGSFVANISNTKTPTSNSKLLYIGEFGTYTPSGSNIGRYFDGILDEVRLAATNRSASWILAEYNNQNSPSTFFTLGSETSLAGGSTSDFFQLF